jgi:xylulokinase
MSLLGVDIGTTGCKAAAFAADGACLAQAYREYPTLYPQPGRAELDSRVVLDHVKAAIAQTSARTAGDPVTAICVSSMGEAMTPIAASGEILDHSILHVDLRGGEYVDRLRAEIGPRAFYDINPNILGPNYSLPKLMWLRDNQRELYEKTWKFLLWGDLVTFALCGEPVTSTSLANRTLLFDIRRETWSERMLAWSGIDAAKLPRIVPGGAVAGVVAERAATEFGLPQGVTVVVGGHDQCCNSLGAGVCAAGKASCGIGTVECIAPVYDHIPDTDAMLPLGLNVEHHAAPGLYLSFLYNQGGVLVRWFRDVFANADRALLDPGEDIYDVLMRETPADPTKLLVLPHFEITGSPDFIADSAGVIAGLTTSSTRGEILKAILESETFYFVEPLDALRKLDIDTSEFIATGGGAKSDAWLQIKADIFGVPFARPRFTECGVLGAAILAGAATGVYGSLEEGVAQCVRRDRVFEPDSARHTIYRERHALYQRLYPAMKTLLRDL